MRKSFFVALIMGSLFTAHAGYVIRGINAYNIGFEDLKNYTLSFDAGNNPIAAGSMYWVAASGIGRNCIVIINANVNFPNAQVFSIPLTGYDPDVEHNIEVRDFKKIRNDIYVLCGSRQVDNDVHAFVAVVTNGFTTMRFCEYSEATVFYSIYEDVINTQGAALPKYYVCGTRGDNGVIVAIYMNSLQIANFYVTGIPWEYHKIIVKQNNNSTGSYYVVSGRNPGRTQIGFTTFDPLFIAIDNYRWDQVTESASHCVVADYVLEDNKIILASSYQNTVTLNPVTFPLLTGIPISIYRFTNPYYVSYSIQDIGAIFENGDVGISVAGFRWQHTPPVMNHAWHGYVHGLFSTSSMRNNIYTGASEWYEHYKIRYDNGVTYTGGYYRGNNSTSALFATPLRGPDECDFIYWTSNSDHSIGWFPFSISSFQHDDHDVYTFQSSLVTMYYDDECGGLKRGEALDDNEIEIIAFSDYITVKNIPTNTNYQIYNVVGQLVQAGTTTSDISTVQLGKGVYILRLESGKTLKFVK